MKIFCAFLGLDVYYYFYHSAFKLGIVFLLFELLIFTRSFTRRLMLLVVRLRGFVIEVNVTLSALLFLCSISIQTPCTLPSFVYNCSQTNIAIIKVLLFTTRTGVLIFVRFLLLEDEFLYS